MTVNNLFVLYINIGNWKILSGRIIKKTSSNMEDRVVHIQNLFVKLRQKVPCNKDTSTILDCESCFETNVPWYIGMTLPFGPKKSMGQFSRIERAVRTLVKTGSNKATHSVKQKAGCGIDDQTVDQLQTAIEFA